MKKIIRLTESDLRRIVDRVIKEQEDVSLLKSEDYPEMIFVMPQDPDHPVGYFILKKIDKKRKGTTTPRYITVYPEGLDDFYEVDQIDFENGTLDAY
jgi:hypothetical protein